MVFKRSLISKSYFTLSTFSDDIQFTVVFTFFDTVFNKQFAFYFVELFANSFTSQDFWLRMVN